MGSTATVARPTADAERREQGTNRLSALLSWIYEPVLAHRRAFAVLSLVYFGALLVGMAYVAIDPGIQRPLVEALGTVFTTGPLSSVGSAYLNAELLQAIALTFVVNLVVGSFVYLTLPSLVFGLGIVVGVLRAILWGLLFAPFGGVYGVIILPHFLTLLIEGLAYVIVMLGVWLWWRPVFSQPGRRLRGWADGLKMQPRVYVAVAFTLAVAAVYEAVELVLLIPSLR